MTFSYDDERDALFVNLANQKVEGSAVFGDFVFDMTKEGRIVGLEIKHISEYLEGLGQEPEKLLKNIIDAELEVSTKRDAYILAIRIKTQLAEQRIPILMPMQAAVAA